LIAREEKKKVYREMIGELASPANERTVIDLEGGEGERMGCIGTAIDTGTAPALKSCSP